MVGIVILLALAQPVSTSSVAEVYRKAALRFQGDANLLLSKNQYLTEMWELCEHKAETWERLAEVKPSPMIEERVPGWVWPTFAGATVSVFVVGFLLGTQ